MSYNFITSFFIILISVMFPLHADQAAYIQQEDAIRAMRLLQGSINVKMFCAPCGDVEAELVALENTDIVDVNYENYWEVQINFEGIDLAYTYFNSQGRWRNVAITLHLPVVDVPEYIE